MPTYEFRCPSGHSFERFYRKIADAATELECPVCGQVATRQLSGGAGLLFKGSGFYLTDYGRNAHRKDGAAHGTGSQKSESSESTGESKSDTKAGTPKADSGGESKRTDAASDAKSGSGGKGSNPSTSSKPAGPGGSES